MAENRDLANGAPLGLIGFGLTTVLIGLMETSWLPLQSGGVDVVIPLAFAFGGTMQLFAGWMQFYNGDTFETVAFSSYGAFWWWFGLLELFSAMNVLNPASWIVGVALVGWGVFTTYMWVSTFTESWSLWIVFTTLALAFYCLGFADWLSVSWLANVGGYFAIASGLSAAYVSFAMVTNEMYDNSPVPTGGRPFSGSGRPGSQSAGD